MTAWSILDFDIIMSASKFSDLQHWTDQILVYGLNSNVQRYFPEEAE